MYCKLARNGICETFADKKGYSKVDRKNKSKEKGRKDNNSPQSATTTTTKDRARWTSLKTGVEVITQNIAWESYSTVSI